MIELATILGTGLSNGWSALWRAVFLDIPYAVDSFTRRADYNINRAYRPANHGEEPQPRSALLRPSAGLMLVVLFFTAYGPTYNALCGLGWPAGVIGTTHFLASVFQIGAFAQFFWTCIHFHRILQRKFERDGLQKQVCRYRIAHAITWTVLALWAVPLWYLGHSMHGEMAGGCQAHAHSTPAIIQLIALFVAVAIAAIGLRYAPSMRMRLLCQVVAIELLATMTMMPLDGPKSEAAHVPYLHVFAVIAAGLGIIAVLSTWLIHIPFWAVSEVERRAADDALDATELFAGPRVDPELSTRRVLGGLVTGLLARPLHFLMLPSFSVLLSSAELVKVACIVGSIASALLITAGSLATRWDRMLQYLRRYFLLGTPFVVSAAVMVIAMLRLAGVQYVTTLLNVAPFGMIFLWIVMAYVLCWWFEYQVNAILAAQILKIFGAKGGWDDERVPYPFVPGQGYSGRVALCDRYLTGHGMGELIVVGEVREPRVRGFDSAFEAYGFVDLIEKLLGRANPGETHELIKRVELYFALVNLAIAMCFVVLAWHWSRGDRENTVHAMITAVSEPTSAADSPADLAALLTQDPDHPKESAIVVSASGGGTRAALYTAVTLRGLHNLHVDDRVVLLSGVSGGAVASAYFYGHRNGLLGDEPLKCAEADKAVKSAWDCFEERMTMPFIDDVLRGASEWRIQSDDPLGILLAESFERRLFTEESLTVSGRSDVGLILNTTVSGHPLHDAPALDGTLASSAQENTQDCERPVSALGGGRLAFSNLVQVKQFSKTDDEVPSVGMPFLVLRDSKIELARAAALSANFPPVFPNARVNVTGFEGAGKPCDTRSYYVTDGGATENLSLVSALLAIDSALDAIPEDKKIRPIDIVLAEASALQFDYSQDRGIGAATDQAKERLTGRLTLELLDRLSKRVTIHVRDLSLPRVFRSRGGFGTHWEWPGKVVLEDPLRPTPASAWERIESQIFGVGNRTASLNKDQLITLWEALYDPAQPFCARTWQDEDSRTTSRWICGSNAQGDGKPVALCDPQIDRWVTLKRDLADSHRDALAWRQNVPPPQH